jgi:hypothetical protein
MPKILIKGTPISIPDSAQSPNWAPGIIEGFQALADAVNSISATYDVAPQVLNIDAYNPGTNIDATNLIFPPTEVRAATIYYTVKRETSDSGPPDGEQLAEAGTLEIVYNEGNPVTQKWEIVRTYEGEANISFSVTDLGQIRFTTQTITGIDHSGLLSYRALSILNV